MTDQGAPRDRAAWRGQEPSPGAVPHQPVEQDGVLLRAVTAADLPIFFAQQLDPTANQLAAFTAKDPADHNAFMAHWARILGDDTVTVRTVLWNGHVVGHVASYVQAGAVEVTYWLGKEYWGQGIATLALATFVASLTVRPLYARVAQDNRASIRVLEKCGFALIGADRGFANARGAEIDEVVLRLDVMSGTPVL